MIFILEKLRCVTKDERQTALHYAAKNNAVGAMKVLLKLGASMNDRDYRLRTALHLAAENGKKKIKFNDLGTLLKRFYPQKINFLSNKVDFRGSAMKRTTLLSYSVFITVALQHRFLL